MVTGTLRSLIGTLLGFARTLRFLVGIDRVFVGVFPDDVYAFRVDNWDIPVDVYAVPQGVRAFRGDNRLFPADDPASPTRKHMLPCDETGLPGDDPVLRLLGRRSQLHSDSRQVDHRRFPMDVCRFPVDFPHGYASDRRDP